VANPKIMDALGYELSNELGMHGTIPLPEFENSSEDNRSIYVSAMNMLITPEENKPSSSQSPPTTLPSNQPKSGKGRSNPSNSKANSEEWLNIARQSAHNQCKHLPSTATYQNWFRQKYNAAASAKSSPTGQAVGDLYRQMREAMGENGWLLDNLSR
jgi:hypothetical protein